MEYIMSKYENIIIDKIKEKNKEINFESKNIKSTLNLKMNYVRNLWDVYVIIVQD